MQPGHSRNMANLTALTNLTSLHLSVNLNAWPFACVRNLPKLEAAFLQLDVKGDLQAATGPLQQEQRLTSLLLWCPNDSPHMAPAPKVSNLSDRLQNRRPGQ